MYNRPVLLFDGVCNLCNGAVNFILKHEKSPDLKFAPLQSEIAGSMIAEFRLSKIPDSLILIKDGKIFCESSAAFEIAGFLKQPYNSLRVFRFIPRFITDFFYRVVASSRYSIFGKRDACMIPSEELKDRFI